MAKSRVRANRRQYNTKAKEPKWSKNKKVFMTVMGVVLTILMILAIIRAIIKYYRLVTQ